MYAVRNKRSSQRAEKLLSILKYPSLSLRGRMGALRLGVVSVCIFSSFPNAPISSLALRRYSLPISVLLCLLVASVPLDSHNISLLCMICDLLCIVITASKFMIDTGAGVIDADYRGVVFVLLFNLSDQDFTGPYLLSAIAHSFLFSLPLITRLMVWLVVCS